MLKRSGLATNAPAIALVAGVSLLSSAFVFGSSPFTSPDEGQHYLRAIGVGHGHLIGRKVPDTSQGYGPDQRAWVEQATYAVRVPDGLSPMNSGCVNENVSNSAACAAQAPLLPGGVLSVQVGNYQPLPYVLPGLATRGGHSPISALLYGRIAAWLDAVVFLIAGTIALVAGRHRPDASLVGAGLALSPLVLYMAAALNPSGLETATGFALACGLLRLSEQASPRLWSLVAVSGFVLAISRAPGAVWTSALVAFFVVWHGPRRSLSLVRSWPRAAALTGGALAAGVGLNRWWESRYGSRVSSVVPTVAEAWESVRALVPRMSREAIGVFGHLDLSLPSPAIWLWEGMVAAAIVGGVALSSGYRRFVLLATALALAVLPTMQFFFVTKRTGFPIQARHLLPVLVLLPLVAFESLRRSTVPWAAQAVHWSTLALVPIAAIDGVAWWINARRAAVGLAGPVVFLGSATWRPPLGWFIWAAVAATGVALIGGAGVLAFRRGIATSLQPSLSGGGDLNSGVGPVGACRRVPSDRDMAVEAPRR